MREPRSFRVLSRLDELAPAFLECRPLFATKDRNVWSFVRSFRLFVLHVILRFVCEYFVYRRKMCFCCCFLILLFHFVFISHSCVRFCTLALIEEALRVFVLNCYYLHVSAIFLNKTWLLSVWYCFDLCFVVWNYGLYVSNGNEITHHRFICVNFSQIVTRKYGQKICFTWDFVAFCLRFIYIYI